MYTIYQPIVKTTAEEIVNSLIKSEFFIENEIPEGVDVARIMFSDLLTQKFIEGKLDINEEIFNEDEFLITLQRIVTLTVINNLKKKGLVGGLDDDDNEELFFLTKHGKEVLKIMKKEEGE